VQELNVTTLTQTDSMSVIDCRCSAGPNDKPFVEWHRTFSLSFVTRGSFGCRVGSNSFELIPGSLLVGYPGDEYICTHDHHVGGDDCLSFGLSAALIDALPGRLETWRIGYVPPLAELMVLAGLAQASAEGQNDFSLEEVGTVLSHRFTELVSGEPHRTSNSGSRVRRQIVDAAHRIAAYANETLTLDQMAGEAALSAFHFLRSFTKILGVTPHQYLVRCRLRRAAHLLSDLETSITEIAHHVGFGDLSNFIRTFHRAAGISPRAFRELGKGDRNILQEILNQAVYRAGAL
jgi:AraC family transcriptional regulator